MAFYFRLLTAGALALCPGLVAAQALPAFSKVVVFGDSLSDNGNIQHVVEDKFVFISFPSLTFNYADDRFTNSSLTLPPSRSYSGTWHEQLAETFLGLPAATNSLDGGRNYAFGGTTIPGASYLQSGAFSRR